MNKNDILNYKDKLKKEKEEFHNWLGSATRYLSNKRLKEIKYYG